MLEESRRLGFLGPGPVDVHLEHGAGFADALAASLPRSMTPAPARGADLGSGGGVPGLPLALRFPACRWTLVDSAGRRASFLRDAVRELGLDGRVDVVERRAEEVGRSPEHRGTYDLVVARGFGPPAVVAECAAPLLSAGGRAVVSEPPGGAPARWPAAGLALVGMVPEASLVTGGWAYQVLTQDHPCPDRHPRRVGVPAKRPLF